MILNLDIVMVIIGFPSCILALIQIYEYLYK